MATPTSLEGRTIRWTFSEGPTAGKTFEHTFNADGSVDYWMLGPTGKGKPTHEQKCATTRVGDDVFVVSYLSGSGYTLTVILHLPTGTMVGFASNQTQWFEQRGAFTLVG